MPSRGNTSDLGASPQFQSCAANFRVHPKSSGLDAKMSAYSSSNAKSCRFSSSFRLSLDALATSHRSSRFASVILDNCNVSLHFTSYNIHLSHSGSFLCRSLTFISRRGTFGEVGVTTVLATRTAFPPLLNQSGSLSCHFWNTGHHTSSSLCGGIRKVSSVTRATRQTVEHHGDSTVFKMNTVFPTLVTHLRNPSPVVSESATTTWIANFSLANSTDL